MSMTCPCPSKCLSTMTRRQKIDQNRPLTHTLLLALCRTCFCRGHVQAGLEVMACLLGCILPKPSQAKRSVMLLCCVSTSSAGRSPGIEGVITVARMVRRQGYYHGLRLRRRDAQHAGPRGQEGICRPRCHIPERTIGRGLAMTTMAPRELSKPRHRRRTRPRLVTQSNRPRLAATDHPMDHR